MIDFALKAGGVSPAHPAEMPSGPNHDRGLTLYEAVVRHGPSWKNLCAKVAAGELKMSAISDVATQRRVEVDGPMIYEFEVGGTNNLYLGKLTGPNSVIFYDARFYEVKPEAEPRGDIAQLFGFLFKSLAARS